MPNTPRLDRIEARLDKLEEIVIPAPAPEQPDERDVPDPDGTTPRQKWITGVQNVIAGAAAKGETITEDEANTRLIHLLNNMAAGETGP